jgi:hypothetical protein
MLYFPQLTTGAAAQYPLVKRRVFRSVSNVLGDGKVLTMVDFSAGRVVWELTYRGLAETERAALELFFQQAEGRLKTFTFLDPVGNLLQWSERLSEPVWDREPMLVLTEGRPDPTGTFRATAIANSGAEAQEIGQTLPAPGWYQYCFSAYVRSDAAAELALVRTSVDTQEEQVVSATPSWRRVWLSGRAITAAERVRFGLRVNGGTAIEVWGLQVEPQLHPSAYKATAAKGGVYPAARFEADALRITAEALGQYSCKIYISAPLAG